MDKKVKILKWVWSDSVARGFVIKCDGKDFAIGITRDDLYDEFMKCYEYGDPEHFRASRMVSIPREVAYWEHFFDNKIVAMPRGTFTWERVDIPLWNGKEEGYYFDDKDQLHDLHSLNLPKLTGNIYAEK